MTPTPQQIKAALNEYFRPIDPSAWKYINRIKLSFSEQEYETIRALLQQASDEEMVRVPIEPPHDVISRMGDLAQRIALSKEYPWPRYMMDLYAIALTAADAGEVKP